MRGSKTQTVLPSAATAAMSEQHYAAGLAWDDERSFQFYPVHGDVDDLVEIILVNTNFIHRLPCQLTARCSALAFFGCFHFKGRYLSPDPGAAAFWALNFFAFRSYSVME